MKPFSTLWCSVAGVCGLVLLTPQDTCAGQMDIMGPAGSGAFPTSITVLPNGNFVVTDPGYDAPGPIADVGAAYLYNGVTFALISTLKGSTANDQVGSGGVTVLSNGNYVVLSPLWNGSRGAVTWASGNTGVNGAVAGSNSLVGTTANDRVGLDGITTLNNGNYVVRSTNWNGQRGAVTWGNGTTGVKSKVAADNSLVGGTANDGVGSSGVVVLTNGNYLVKSAFWDNGADPGAPIVDAGAVTWGNGTTGVSGFVSAANSMIGSTTDDRVGTNSVIALTNGNYVVCASGWDTSGGRVDAGAVRWGNGTTGVSGAITAANSLTGTRANDNVGHFAVALSNGHYVVSSLFWDNGTVADVGAATWGNGTTGMTGAVSAANSLVGSTANDNVGDALIALSNGNYVVRSVAWDNGAVINAGAATWGNGTTGVTGAVSVGNSLVGSTPNDGIGSFGFTTLNNGNYVVRSPNWDNGAAVDAGAVTWGNGTSGLSGAVSAANSLVGSTGEGLGNVDVTVLPNGNYVVRLVNWNTNRGAVTWGNGTTGVSGAISTSNSLVGSAANDKIGEFGAGVLTNGNYVVRSPSWNGNLGAMTWGSGTTGITGTVSAANSLIGSIPLDLVGWQFTALNNGNYVARSPYWDNGGVVNAGAVTWGHGATGITGTISTANSLVGSAANDELGLTGVTAFGDGDYAVNTPAWDNATPMATDAGAVSLGDGTLGTSGVISAANSVLGTASGGGASALVAYDLLNTRLLVGYPADNRVSLFGYHPEIAVQQPLGVEVPDGGTRTFGAPVGADTSLTFTIKNLNVGTLTGLGITTDGPDASLFTVLPGPIGTTTFTVRFTPNTEGLATAALHIANNDADENPYDINLIGRGLSATQDTDGDGLNDVSEFELAALGFDWQASQPTLVTDLFANANNAGLFTPSQIQALHVGTPLLQRNPGTGQFLLTIGVRKSAALNIPFTDFPMSAPQTSINPQGKLEFLFTVPDNAAFFLLESN